MEVALRLGATGIATTAWLTADGSVALHPRGYTGRLRRRPLAELHRSDLPEAIPTLDVFHQRIGIAVPLLISAASRATMDAVVDHCVTVRAADALLVAGHDWRHLAEIRNRSAGPIRLIHVTAPATIDGSMERHASTLRDAGIHGMAIREDHWSGGSVALLHRFQRLCLATGAHHERMIRHLLHIGIDGVVGDHADRLHDASAASRH